MKSGLFLLIFLFIFSSCQKRNEPIADIEDKSDSVDFSGHLPNELLGPVKVETGDLDSMISRRYIRAAVPYSITYYYVDGKNRKGVALELLTLFEKELNKAMKFKPGHIGIIFIPVNRELVIPMVRDGYADIGVAGLAITPERQKEIDYAAPVVTGLNEIIVAAPGAPPLSNLGDLSGKEIYTHHSSGYEASLMRINDSLVSKNREPARIVVVDPFLEIEDLLEMTDAGLIPYIACLDFYANRWKDVLDSMTVYDNLKIRKDVSLAWVMRKNSPKLKKQVDKFMATNHKGTLMGNVVYNKYLGPARLKKVQSKQSTDDFNSVQGLFQKYGGEYHLDWLLLAAQGYQESQLNQKSVSSVGAVGVMQIKPSTAAGNPIHIANVHILDNNIHAGTKYMRFLIDQYFPDKSIDSVNQHLLALAAYNAGPGRIARLRREAAAQGYNPNVWFGELEHVVAHEVGQETVQYVGNIYKYYISYKGLERYQHVREKLGADTAAY